MGSRASQRSKGGVSKNSYVDETLFGAKKSNAAANSNVISIDELRTIRQKAVNNNQNDAVVISAKDFSRIKDATTI